MKHSKTTDTLAQPNMKLGEAVEELILGLNDQPVGAKVGMKFRAYGYEFRLAIELIGPVSEESAA